MARISIITPCYNSARYIGETVASVRAQTLSDWEMVIVDDGSTDDSGAVIAAYLAEEPRLRLIRKPNGGVASARNTGFRESNSESKYLIFLDADDSLEPTALGELADYLDTRAEVGMVYCDPMLIGPDSRVLHDNKGPICWQPKRLAPTRFGVRHVPPEVPETTLDSLFALTTITPSMSLIRRTIYLQTPGFDEAFGHLYEDMDIFMQIALRSQVHHYPRTLLRYRQHPSQSTANKDKLCQQEQKLIAKWRNLVSNQLPDEDAQRVRAALQFLEGRVVPLSGFGTALELFQRGEVIAGLRFFGGALRRYIPSLVLVSPKRTRIPSA